MEQPGVAELAGNPRSFSMEHRWGQRMPCQARVRLTVGLEFHGAGHVRDISSSGAFIETALELPVNSRVELLVLGNESATHAVEFKATVVRVDRDGVGVEWCETPAGSICAAVGCTTRCAALTTPRCQPCATGT